MGPQATQVFYQYVLDRTEASCDQEHLPALILSDTGVPDRTASILTGNTEPMYQRLLADARLLEECGCTVIAIPCNTSHYFVDRIQQEIGIPILHMIRETARTLVAQGKRRPAILATDGTIRTGLYQKECAAFGLEAAPPEPAVQRLVMSIIYEEIKRGERGSREKFAQIDRALASMAVTAPFWAAPSCPSSAATTACPLLRGRHGGAGRAGRRPLRQTAAHHLRKHLRGGACPRPPLERTPQIENGGGAPIHT